MTNDLIAAVAEIKRVSPASSPWEAGDIGVGQSPVDYQIAVILNAVASCALVPAADVQGLVKAAKWLRATAQEGFRTADFHRGECSCPRCAEDALFAALSAWENRNG